MKLIDYILIACVAAAVAYAVHAIRSGKGKGCCGDCASCVERCKKGSV